MQSPSAPAIAWPVPIRDDARPQLVPRVGFVSERLAPMQPETGSELLRCLIRSAPSDRHASLLVISYARSVPAPYPPIADQAGLAPRWLTPSSRSIPEHG